MTYNADAPNMAMIELGLDPETSGPDEWQQAADLLFELLNGTAKRGLRHIAFFGRAREIQPFADGQEISDVMDFHGIPPTQRQYSNSHLIY